jgi:hypothetical protein
MKRQLIIRFDQLPVRATGPGINFIKKVFGGCKGIGETCTGGCCPSLQCSASHFTYKGVCG